MSHHDMATFMSSTDIKELTDSAPLHNCFMSLVVNNEGTYTVAFSTMGKNSIRTVKNEVMSFRNFDGQDVECEEIQTNTDVVVDVVYYAYGNITKEERDANPFQFISDQLSKIRKTKKEASTAKAVNTWQNSWDNRNYSSKPSYPSYPSNTYKSPSNSLFKGIYEDDEIDTPTYNNSYTPPSSPLTKPESVDDNKQFCNSILTLGLRSDYVYNVTSFLDDLAVTDIDLYEEFLPNILDTQLNSIYMGDYAIYKDALDFALNFFKRYEYDCIVKTIIKVLKEELESVEVLLK